MISRTLAVQLFQGEDPVGRTITVQYGEPASFEVVGLVADTKRGYARRSTPEVYIRATGGWVSNYMRLIVRSRATAAA